MRLLVSSTAFCMIVEVSTLVEDLIYQISELFFTIKKRYLYVNTTVCPAFFLSMYIFEVMGNC